MAITVTTGNIAVQFDDDTDWFPINMTRAGSGISTNGASVNGCVIQINGVFIGGQHGFSDVVNAHLTVDGARVDFVDGGSYVGNTAIFNRVVDYSGVLQLEHTMLLRNNKVDENFTLRTLESGYTISIFYGCLRSIENRFSGYRVYNGSGLMSMSGNTILDDDNNTAQVSLPLSVHQFDAIRGNNVVHNWYVPNEAVQVTFIDDRPADNKLYLSMGGWAAVTTDKNYHWSQNMRFS